MLARGSAVHKITELYDYGRLAEADERLTGFLNAYKAFLRDTGFKPSLIEHRVVSSTHRYAGTLDRIGMIGPKTALVDIKSGTPAKAAALQTAGYRMAHKEMTGEAIEIRLALRLSSDGKYSVTQYTDHSKDERIFAAAVSLWHWKHS
jgi:hypothetical protein